MHNTKHLKRHFETDKRFRRRKIERVWEGGRREREGGG